MLPLEYRRKRVALLLFFLVCVLIAKNRHTLPPAEGRAKLQEEKMKEIEKNYNPAEIEDRLYEKWQEKKYFHAEVDRSKKPFTIVMPPPNITGQLHMGHALDNTMQDILIRFKRMQGYEALWLPGTDHASIATEAKIVEKMREEGITKEDLGREKFLDRAWQWKAQYGGRIVSQLKKKGSLCDWGLSLIKISEPTRRRGISYAVFCLKKKKLAKHLVC